MTDDDKTLGSIVPIVNNAIDAPMVYADAAIFATMLNGVVRITFAQTLADAADDPNPGWKTRKVATVLLPADGFVGMMEYLDKQLAFFKAQGWISNVATGEG